MKAKPWQIALIVVGLLVGVGSAAWFVLGGDRVTLEHRYYLIDVESGEIFEVNAKKYKLMLPARHPDTNKIALVGVSQGEGGVWFVPERQLGMLKQLDKTVQIKALNPDSGELIGPPTKPRRYAPR